MLLLCWRGRRAMRGRRSGTVLVVVMLAVVSLLACAAVTTDVGLVMLSAQRCQDVADAAALAGGPLLGSRDAAVAAAQAIVAANNVNTRGLTVSANYSAGSGASDIVAYASGDSVPGLGTLGPGAAALRVRCGIDVQYTFGRAVGLMGRRVSKAALVVRGPIAGASIVPMWVSEPTPYSYGVSQNLYMADTSEAPGNFGWLDLPAGVDAEWTDCLAGVPLSEAAQEELYAAPGEVWSGKTGQRVGQWTAALQERLDRAAGAPWTGESFASHSADNPHIMVLPLVTYLGGNGTNAQYRIDRFGAFWLDSFSGNGSNKTVNGRFLEYVVPGAEVDPTGGDSGLYAVRLVQ